MWLLNTLCLRLEWHSGDIPKYATLSHRWEKDEVEFKHVFQGTAATRNRKGWHKVLNCCKLARNAGIPYVWIDTCCIDKSNSAQLQEAINSMYRYYERSFRCYAYLNDVYISANTASEDEIFDEVSKSEWFTRGWTLQELIAPRNLVFYNHSWEYLWAKRAYSRQLQQITRIDRKLLEGEAKLQDFSVAQRMAWAAFRFTSKIEDEAYSLLGIFQISMSLLYGEGKKAFYRLQQEIIREYDDQTLFAWHDNRQDIHVKPVLAPSVACFKGLEDLKCINATNDRRHGHTFSNTGLNIQLMLIPWSMNIYVAPLSCGRIISGSQLDGEQSIRRYRRMGIFLRKTQYEDVFIRVCASVNGRFQDSVMLDSDVVACKRTFYKINNSLISIRQTQLLDIPDEVHHSFTFSFNHAQLFRNGYMPMKGRDVKNDCYEELDARRRKGFILEGFSHFESAAFEVTSIRKRPHFLYLGYGIDFAPVCLITSRSFDDCDTGDTAELDGGDFDGMYRRDRPCMTLSRLLSIVDGPLGADVVLAFVVRTGKSSVIQCYDLSLKIEFKLKEARHALPGMGLSGKIWHVRFDSIVSTSDSPLPQMRRFSSAPNPAFERSPDVTVKKGLLTRFFSLKPTQNEKKYDIVTDWLGSLSTATTSSRTNVSGSDEPTTAIESQEEVRFYPNRKYNDIYETDSAEVSPVPLRQLALSTVHELDTVHRSELSPAHMNSPVTMPQAEQIDQTIPDHEIDGNRQWLSPQINNFLTVPTSRQGSVSQIFTVPRKSLPPRSAVTRTFSSITRDDVSAN